MNSEIYPAKVLLFGEYTILYGGDALSLPINRFEGVLSRNREIDSHGVLQEFYHHLHRNKEQFIYLDLDLFSLELDRGLSFISNIPMGQGLGSSGALVASLYEHLRKEEGEDLDKLIRKFSEMESFFHGKSSGFDPLVSYLKKPIVFSQNSPSLSELHWPKEISIFLVNSGRNRKTQYMMSHFQEKFNSKDFQESFLEKLLPAQNQAIQALLENSFNLKKFWLALTRISLLQGDDFSPMFPQALMKLLKEGLYEDHTRVKILGAGGGGYFLAFSLDKRKTMELLVKNGLRDFFLIS